MTLTFELIQDIIKVNACTKFWVCMSNGSAVRELTDAHTHTHTDRQTDGTDFIPSTADAGGKYCHTEQSPGIQKMTFSELCINSLRFLFGNEQVLQEIILQ